MNVYAIHRERNCHVDYNVAVCSTKKIAENRIEKFNKDYLEFKKSVQEEIDKLHPNNDYKCDTKPEKYIIEKIKVISK
jgi:myosin heavy subunit